MRGGGGVGGTYFYTWVFSARYVKRDKGGSELPGGFTSLLLLHLCTLYGELKNVEKRRKFGERGKKGGFFFLSNLETKHHHRVVGFDKLIETLLGLAPEIFYLAEEQHGL